MPNIIDVLVDTYNRAGQGRLFTPARFGSVWAVYGFEINGLDTPTAFDPDAIPSDVESSIVPPIVVPRRGLGTTLEAILEEMDSELVGMMNSLAEQNQELQADMARSWLDSRRADPLILTGMPYHQANRNFLYQMGLAIRLSLAQRAGRAPGPISNYRTFIDIHNQQQRLHGQNVMQWLQGGEAGAAPTMMPNDQIMAIYLSQFNRSFPQQAQLQQGNYQAWLAQLRAEQRARQQAAMGFAFDPNPLNTRFMAGQGYWPYVRFRPPGPNHPVPQTPRPGQLFRNTSRGGVLNPDAVPIISPGPLPDDDSFGGSVWAGGGGKYSGFDYLDDTYTSYGGEYTATSGGGSESDTGGH